MLLDNNNNNSHNKIIECTDLNQFLQNAHTATTQQFITTNSSEKVHIQNFHEKWQKVEDITNSYCAVCCGFCARALGLISFEVAQSSYHGGQQSVNTQSCTDRHVWCYKVSERNVKVTRNHTEVTWLELPVLSVTTNHQANHHPSQWIMYW